MTHTTLKVLIVAGGLTHERDVSLRSGRRVANVLAQAGYEVRVCDADERLLSTIDESAPDVIWPLVHGSIGEDGSLQAVLEQVGVPFVGSAAVQSMLASNKPTAKSLLAAAGMATPGWVTLPQALFRQLGAGRVLDAVETGIEFPVVIKPTDGGSALGISTASDGAQLRAAMVDAFAYGERVMVEQLIGGRDVAVSVVDLEDGPVALPPVEISTDGGRYDYEARYTTDSTEYFVPARLGEEALEDLRAAAVEAHTVLGLRDVSRIDFVIDEAGACWFIDANVVPGMTDTSLLPQAADADGSFAALCSRIVEFVAAGRPVRDGAGADESGE
ncbi:D-alanine--D-alanine ligase [Actinomyces sp. B33]|uniref:D-alanine--D-alanine ligase family protein n=1 Tax=Actinomyces sp. B33 TaxID=2942131 RepID=UPI0023401959|nr:D-alanine--D-alanine ligase [Actinomyces sp. B33]MDC4232535.1 D-alanine--D-alanine ligase [Actinomyces sp. B33]